MLLFVKLKSSYIIYHGSHYIKQFELPPPEDQDHKN